MRWKFFSPNKKKNRYKLQLKHGCNEKAEELSAKDISYRYGYIQAVNDSNAIYAYNHATPEQRAAYKARKKNRRK